MRNEERNSNRRRYQNQSTSQQGRDHQFDRMGSDRYSYGQDRYNTSDRSYGQDRQGQDRSWGPSSNSSYGSSYPSDRGYESSDRYSGSNYGSSYNSDRSYNQDRYSGASGMEQGRMGMGRESDSFDRYRDRDMTYGGNYNGRNSNEYYGSQGAGQSDYSRDTRYRSADAIGENFGESLPSDRSFSNSHSSYSSYGPNSRSSGRYGSSSFGSTYGQTEDRSGHYGRGPKGWKRSDERIKEEVCEALYRDSEVDASEIDVTVKEGTVTLKGSVESREAKRAAERCVENLSGVDDVQNEIKVSRSEDTHSASSRTGSQFSTTRDSKTGTGKQASLS